MLFHTLLGFILNLFNLCKGGAHPILGKYSNIWVESVGLSLFTLAHTPLVPGETARERRHPSDARLESSFYAQFPFEGSLGPLLGPLLEESLPEPPAGGGSRTFVSWAFAFERRPLIRILTPVRWSPCRTFHLGS